MKTLSCFSTRLDPYRAGIEIGERLTPLEPEVIFLFPTVHYQGSPELLEALFEALAPIEPVIIGNTGDGFYELEKVANVGVSALGINCGGLVQWHLAHEKGIGEAPFETTRKCIQDVNEACSGNSPAFYFLSSDFRTDASEIIRALNENARAPVIGGLAGDDDRFKSCFQYANHEVLSDSISVLAATGEIKFDIQLANTLQPFGKPGDITESDGTNVLKIDELPAMQFLENSIGKPLDVVDEGTVTFKLQGKAHGREYLVRSLLLPDDRSREQGVRLFGGIESGARAQVCLASPDKMIRDVANLGKNLDKLTFKPQAAIIVSCAGRKKVLGGRIDNEVTDIVQGCPSLQALVGYPSFGEFGPLKDHQGYSRTLFHNMTFIILLIGEE